MNITTAAALSSRYLSEEMEMALGDSGEGWRLGLMGRQGIALFSEVWICVIRSWPSLVLAVEVRTATH